MKASHPIIGDVRCRGCLMGIELVKDREQRNRSTKRGIRLQKRFQKGAAWIPAGHILRMSRRL